jgi:hypothetical protein
MNLIRKRFSQGIAGRRSAREYSQFRLKDHARRRSKPPKWWTKWWARSRPAIALGEIIRMVPYYQLHLPSGRVEYGHASRSEVDFKTILHPRVGLLMLY